MTHIVNAMTVDVEDYFQVSAFESRIARSDWGRWPSRVERNTHRVLDMFDAAGVKATFFVLGWVAEKFPEVVRRIVADGHELASHGYSHVRATEQTRDEFSADVTRTKSILEDVGGTAVLGYRAASYSIGPNNLWALGVLAETGHEYSSSIYPVRHDLYGIPDAPRFPFYPEEGNGILEVPVTTVELAGRNMPVGGGGYFRLYPYFVSRWGLRHVNSHDRQSGVFYFHPWEIDVDQPRPEQLRWRTRFRHYLNLSRMQERLERLLRDFHWDRMDRVFLQTHVRGSTQTIALGLAVAGRQGAARG